MKTIAVLGSTGSIGTQTLEVVRANPDLRVAALSAGRNLRLLEKQIREFRPSPWRPSGKRRTRKN